jgi:hypothetical protein
MRTQNVRNALVVASLFALPLALAACKKSDSGAAPTNPSKDYAAEAKSSIDEKNMDAELEKLKAEVEADK